ncbi:PEP-CTERM sorting domain-containing protein [Massilia sp. HP4]|uniref:PEP-CTERM sorting domain-containing protein n=1 Tax=Massilia sp. HP4 TaxID=2562316 RepID=UPI0010C11EC1|nr:PEP-CTERM sorting domain-containing protein [Massilia sp. HP4]
MHHIFRNIAVSAAIALCAPFAQAAVLNFDDIVGPDDYAALPGNYGGLDWTDAGLNVFTGAWPHTPRSGHGQATTDWIDGGSFESTIRFLAPTVFNGAWFSGYEDGHVRFDLYAGGRLVASSQSLQLSGTSTFLDAGWAGAIDAVVVFTNAQGSYGMDDFTFVDPAQVPEPGSLALLLAGAGCLVLRRKQERARS